MTGCVSICVKNLAKVAKVTEWVGRKRQRRNDLLLADIFAPSVSALNFFYVLHLSSGFTTVLPCFCVSATFATHV